MAAMAQSTGESETIGADVAHDSELGRAWREHKEDFDTKSEALRDALRQALLDDGGEATDGDGLTWYQFAVVGLMAGAVASLVAQAMFVFDAVVASGLVALVIVVMVGVIYVYGN